MWLLDTASGSSCHDGDKWVLLGLLEVGGGTARDGLGAYVLMFVEVFAVPTVPFCLHVLRKGGFVMLQGIEFELINQKVMWVRVDNLWLALHLLDNFSTPSSDSFSHAPARIRVYIAICDESVICFHVAAVRIWWGHYWVRNGWSLHSWAVSRLHIIR